MPKDHDNSLQNLIEEKEKLESAHLEAIHNELAPYIEKIEHDPQIPTDLQSHGVVNHQQQASAVISAGPTIVLPLSEDQVRLGLHHKVIDALRWLAEWCLRVAEMAKNKGIAVFFGKDYISKSELFKLEKLDKENANSGSI